MANLSTAMNQNTLRTAFSLLIVGIGTTAATFAGVVFEVETTDHSPSGNTTVSSEMKVEGDNLKMAIATSKKGGGMRGQGEMIFRGENREIVAIDHERKSYFLMDAETLKMMAARLGQMQSQLGMNSEVFKHLPPEARKKLEEAQAKGVNIPGLTPPAGANAAAKPPPEFRKTSERATMEAYPCVKYEKYVDGSMVQELWVTDMDNIDGADDAAEVFESMGGFFAEMKEAFGGRGGPGMGDEDNPFLAFKALNGFPVVTRDFENGELERESVLRSANKVKLDPTEFEPPADYKRQSMGPG